MAKINTQWYDNKGTVTEMQYSFRWNTSEDGSVYMAGSYGGLCAVFKDRVTMLEILDELMTSYPKVIVDFQWTGK